MNDPVDQLVHVECDVDGDTMVCPLELLFWEILDKTRRIFGVDLSFRYTRCDYRAKTDEKIECFIPRDTPHVALIETCIARPLGTICEVLAERMHERDGWRPEVKAWIFRYSAVRGAMAFGDAHEAVMRAGEELNHPDWKRLEKMALEAGSRAAKLATGRR